MEFSELYQSAARLCFDSEYERFPKDQYKDWINKGQLYLARLLPDKFLHALAVKTKITGNDDLSSLNLGDANVLRYFSIVVQGKNVPTRSCIITDEKYFQEMYANYFSQPSGIHPICVTRRDENQEDIIDFYPTIIAPGGG